MKRILLVGSLVALIAAPAVAQLSQEYAGWAEGPEGVLLSAAERTEYGGLASDEEAKEFIDLFWARRDPDLDTRRNEFKVEFESRVLAGDREFSVDDIPGSLSDRGRVLILLGVPDEHGKTSIDRYLAGLYRERPAAPDASPAERALLSRRHGVSFILDVGMADIWRYEQERLPEDLKVPGRSKSITFAFFDPKGTGDFSLATGIIKAELAGKVLAAMPATTVVNPDLDTRPVYPLIAGSPAASEVQLAWLDSDQPWPEDAQAQAVIGVKTEDELVVWLFVRLPGSIPAAEVLAGRMVLADQTVDGTFAAPTAPQQVAEGSVYELALPAPATAATLEIVLAAGGQPLAVRKLEVTGENLSTTFITTMFSGSSMVNVGSFDVGTPFVFGGYHLGLQPDGRYDWDDTLVYFCLLARPGHDEGEQPRARLRLKLFIEGQSKPVSNPGMRPVQLSEVSPNVYMFGSQLPISVLPMGGEFRLELTIKDAGSGVQRRTEIPFVVPEKPTPTPDG